MKKRENSLKVEHTRGLYTILVAIIAAIPLVGSYICTQKNASQYSIKHVGRIIDKDSEQPIRNAKVTFDFQGTSQIEYTNSDGNYFFNVVSNTVNVEAEIRVECDGYVNFSRTITLTTEPKFEDIRLTRKTANKDTSRRSNNGSQLRDTLMNEPKLEDIRLEKKIINAPPPKVSVFLLTADRFKNDIKIFVNKEPAEIKDSAGIMKEVLVLPNRQYRFEVISGTDTCWSIQRISSANETVHLNCPN